MEVLDDSHERLAARPARSTVTEWEALGFEAKTGGER